MYGQIHVVMKEMVETQFGDVTWKKIVSQSGMDEDTDFLVFRIYDDVMTSRLIESVCRVLEMSREQVLKEFGMYFLTYCMKHGYDKMLLTLGRDLFTFVQNLDSLYSMLSLSYKGIVPPSFRCQEHDDGTLTLDYFSWRRGFYPIVQGIVEAVGRHLYQQEATVSLVDSSEEEVSRGTFQYHTTMRVAVHGRTGDGSADGGQAKMPSKERQQRRRMTIDVSTAVTGGNPSRVTMGELCEAFPYHILMDGDLRIHQCGNAIRKLVSLPIDGDTHFFNIATIRQPIISCTRDHILSFINSVFIIDIINMQQQQPAVLRGQMMWLPSSCHILFMGSLRMQSLTDMKEKKIFVSDIPIYDCTRELALLNQQRMSEIEAAKQLDLTTTALKNTSKALAKEKQKTDELLHEMMPRKVALQLTQQGFVNAVKYEWATVLFSCILTFADIVWSCSADQVVDMLNNMYFRFDGHTDVHKVYKVETIGDAYMAVTGVPQAQEDHVERMADFAMDMIEEASYVRSPATGLPLQIQVGFNSGSVVAGVIGHKKPRYDIYGDTVNTASRMCSHSVPSRIHVTSVAFEKLFKRGYVFKNRGPIEVKGKGKMVTYFLVGTLERDLEQPDDKFSFLPDVLDADAQIDPSIKKLIKKKVDVTDGGNKVMVVTQSRKSTVFYRHMRDVQNPGGAISSSFSPGFTDGTTSSQSGIHSTNSLQFPTHRKQTWNLSPPPPSAGLDNFSQAPATRSPHMAGGGRGPGRSLADAQRQSMSYPEHHCQTWNLSPPPPTAADIRGSGLSGGISPAVNKSNSSCHVKDSNPSPRSPNKSNSSCHQDDSTHSAMIPNKRSSSGHKDESNPAPRNPNKSNSSCNEDESNASPNKSNTSCHQDEDDSKPSPRSPNKRDSSGPQDKSTLSAMNPNKSHSSSHEDDLKLTASNPNESPSSEAPEDASVQSLSPDGYSTSSGHCDVISDSSICSGQQGDFNLALKPAAKRTGSSDNLDSVQASPDQLDSVHAVPTRPHRYSPPPSHRRPFSRTSLPVVQNPRAAQAGLFVWSDVRRNIMGNKSDPTSSQQKRQPILRSRHTPATAHDTTSLQASATPQLPKSAHSFFGRWHSITTLRPWEGRDTQPSASHGQEDKKACVVS